MIEKVSQHDYPVLILGESGTGKELVARSDSFRRLAAEQAFVPVDCSALVPTLIEAELFGYVKGAFTGAQQSRTRTAGNRRRRHRCSSMKLATCRSICRPNCCALCRSAKSARWAPPDRVRIYVRIIAATNRDLEASIRTGSFRQDLFFRLNVVQIKLPPLRERKSDIPPGESRSWRNSAMRTPGCARFPKTPCAT